MTSIVDELGLTKPQRDAAFRALRAVVEADGPARARGAQLLEVAGNVLNITTDQAPATPAAPRIEEVFTSPETRAALTQVLIIGACIEGEVTPNGEAAVRAHANALGVKSPWVDLLPALRRRSVFAVKVALMRRSPDARRIFQRIWAEEGLLGVVRAAMFVLGVYRNPKLAQQFHALGALPTGSVGRTFYDHFQAQKIAFPGERGGLPERMVHHDLMHVINGYGTDAAGECELAGFYAGFTTGEPFTFIVTALSTFQLGMQVSPDVVQPARSAFDPARVLSAYLRGRRLRVDVMGPWNYWELMPLSIAAAQARLGLRDAGVNSQSPMENDRLH
jgi:hypothetical protein